jgi:hypothetical protein
MNRRIYVCCAVTLMLVYILTSCGDKKEPTNEASTVTQPGTSSGAAPDPAAPPTPPEVDPIIKVIQTALEAKKSGSEPSSTIKGNCVLLEGTYSDGTPYSYCFYTWKNARCTTVPTDCQSVTGKCTPTNPLPVVPPC